MMIIAYFRDLFRGTAGGWNRFWFTPADPATLGMIRVLAGGMLLYTHLVWSIGLEDFFGPRAWVNRGAAASFGAGSYTWSYFWLIDSPALLWGAHLTALLVFLLFFLGLFTRVTSVLAALATLAYVHRTPGALFGLDQVNAMLAMYLAVGPAGEAYSLDRLRRRTVHHGQPAAASISANLATRLVQVHLCVIYLFAGLSKLGGPNWWAGTALWGAVANLEYQSIDLVFLVHHPLVINALTLGTLAWEISYPALVWHRLTRPLVVAVAVPLHLGIAGGMGMITFGLMMLFANLAFVSPTLTRQLLDRPLGYLAGTVRGARPQGAGGRPTQARCAGPSQLPAAGA